MKDEIPLTTRILARNLQVYRKLENLSQEQLAEMLRVSSNTISKIETCQSFPKPETLDKIVEILHITHQMLFAENIEETLQMKELSASLDGLLEMTTKVQILSQRVKLSLSEQNYTISHGNRTQKKQKNR